jgi:hypothetical protein
VGDGVSVGVRFVFLKAAGLGLSWMKASGGVGALRVK